MASIKLNDFKGLTPRTGEQLLDPGHAVGATNVDLDSGALRPLITPHLENIFPRAGGGDFLTPAPVDPSDPIPEVPVPPECVPVVIVVPPENQTFTFLPETITFAIQTNLNATAPVMIRWYIDDVLIPGETEETLTISPDDTLYGVIQVQVQNPCGIDFAVATVTVEDAFSCVSYDVWARGAGLYYWPCTNDAVVDRFLAGTVNVPFVGNETAYLLRNQPWFGDTCGDQPHWEIRDQFGTESLDAYAVGVRPPLNTTIAMLYRSTAGFQSNWAYQMRQYWVSEPSPIDGRTSTMQVSLFIGPYKDGRLGINNDGADITIPNAIPNDGLPHVIGVRMSGCPASTMTSLFPNPKDTFTCTYEIFVDGVILATTHRVVEIPYMPSIGDPSVPIHFNPEYVANICRLPGSSSDMRFASILIGGDIDLTIMRQAYLNNFQGDPP